MFKAISNNNAAAKHDGELPDGEDHQQNMMIAKNLLRKTDPPVPADGETNDGEAHDGEQLQNHMMITKNFLRRRNDPPTAADGETHDGETQDGEADSGAQGHVLINKLKMNSRNARISKIHSR